MQNTPTPMQKDKQYSDLTQEEKDNLHSKCCEGTNKEQEKMIKAYERGFMQKKSKPMQKEKAYTIVIKEAINKIK